MQKNVGGYDRIARLVFGPALLLLGAALLGEYVTYVGGDVGLALGGLAFAVGAVFTVTALAQRCLLNWLLGTNTYRTPGAGSANGGQ